MLPTHVLIVSHERPEWLRNLVSSLETMEGPLRITVFDDCSANFPDLRSFSRTSAIRASYRHGYEKHHELLTKIFDFARNCPEERFLFLPDDVSICRNFMHEVETHWDLIPDPDKIAMTLLVDPLRLERSGWTPRPFERYGCVEHVGYVDAVFYANARFFRELNYEAPATGGWVWKAISRLLVRKSLGLWRTYASLVDHVGAYESRLVPGHRKQYPLHTVRFIDHRNDNHTP